MRFVLILAALAALQLPSASAAPEDVLATVRARGVLRVGTTGDYLPFSLRGPEGRFVGLDIEMAESFARSLGVRAEFVPTSWPNLMQDLAADRFDLAAGGISVTAERQRQAGFSLPYLTDGKTPIARCEHRSRFATLEDIDRPGVRLVVNPGGTNERFVRARIRRAQVAVFPDNVGIFDQIVAGRADLMITDATEARLQQRLRPDLCAIHPEAPFEVVEKAWLLPRDAAFQAAVDLWLRAELDAGRIAAALERWLAHPWAVAAQRPATEELVALIRARLAIGADVARSKWNSGAPIEDLQREAEIIAALGRQAGQFGLPERWAEGFFRAQIEASKAVQRQLHARWRAEGREKFADAPDLGRDIRPRLDALTPKLLAALAAAWSGLCAPSRRAALLAAAAGAAPPADVGAEAMGTALSGLVGTPACAD